ncbi:hypothetical protein NC651_004236 [Populus alba x Populus x berolinensis]|nr:hypothetical protein NC651_004236 [Populus alba x Populus x berolinensis]
MQGLTNLKTLSLKSLPDMRCISKGLVLSKLTTLEVSEVAEDSSINREWTRDNGWKEDGDSYWQWDTNWLHIAEEVRRIVDSTRVIQSIKWCTECQCHKPNCPSGAFKRQAAGGLHDSEASPMKTTRMPFEKLLTEVIRSVHAPSQSTETNSSLAVNLPVENSGIVEKKDGSDTEQALSVKPLQVLQPIVNPSTA